VPVVQALCKMLQFMKDGNAFVGGGKQAKKTSNTRKDLLNIFRTRFLPEKPSAELLFEVYRLLIPKARLARLGLRTLVLCDRGPRAATDAAHARRWTRSARCTS
jgi:hypothetical protein